MLPGIHCCLVQVHVSVDKSIPQNLNSGATAKSKQAADARPTSTVEKAAEKAASLAKAEPADTEAQEASGTSNAESTQSGNEPKEAAEQPDRKLRQKPSSIAHTSASIERGKPKGYVSAISANGFTTRGRVRQKSHKSAELVSVGKIR